jgi:hypothetical protein
MPAPEPELTPEQLKAQDDAKRELLMLRREGETYIARRDKAVYNAHKLGLSLRQIGFEVGLSAQGVANVVAREKDIEEANAGR